MIRAWLFYAAIAAAVALAYVNLASDALGCITDSECAELCPAGTRDLPPDHPDYCDGGPQPVGIIGVRA